MAKAIEEKKIAYLKSNNFLRLWAERECEVCDRGQRLLSGVEGREDDAQAA